MKTYFLKLDENAVIPEYQTEKSSGFDLVVSKDIYIEAGDTQLVETGLAVILPVDTELQVRPRGSTSLNGPLRIANTPGTVDEDYLNKEVKIICWNVGKIPLLIKRGDRIAQGVICPVIRTDNLEVDETEYNQLAEFRRTSRDGGFGSTGDTSG